MQAVVLAGGLGTRLRPTTETVPKAMVPVNGRPFLEYELELLIKAGVDDFVICIGYLGDMIREHFGDGGSLGARVRYSEDGPKPLGAAGALKRAEPLVGDHFFVTYGDAYLRAPYAEMLDGLLSSDGLAMMAVYRNEDRYGKSDLAVEGRNIVRYDKRGAGGDLRWINFGVTAMRKEALGSIPPGSPCDEEEFYGRLIQRNQLLAFRVKDRFYEIGSPASLDEFGAFAREQGL